ncbi:hypothetical protein AWC38_SpisGene8887, partial [Paramuricea clavata]
MKGSQFWRSNRKIVVVRANQVANIRRKLNSKKRKPVDFIEQLKRLVSDSTDDDFDEPVPLVPISVSRPTTPNLTVEEQAKEMLGKIFNCSICLNRATLPAAACSSCFSVIGCIPCVEQWYKATTTNNNKCPLCRTNRQYNTIPIVREFSSLLQQPLPEEPSQINVPSDDDSLDTIPYGDNETLRNDASDEELPIGL